MRSLEKFTAAPPHPAPPQRGEQGLEVLAPVYLSKGGGGEGGRGPRWSTALPGRPPPPSPGRRAPRRGRGTPGCRPGRCGGRRAARPLTKAGSGPCTCALPRRGRWARPCAGRAGRARRGAAPRRCFPGCRAGEGGPPRVGVPRGRSCSRARRRGCLWGVRFSPAAASPGPRAAQPRCSGPARPLRAPRHRRPKVTAPGAGFSLRATLAERPFTAPGLHRRPG